MSVWDVLLPVRSFFMKSAVLGLCKPCFVLTKLRGGGLYFKEIFLCELRTLRFT